MKKSKIKSNRRLTFYIIGMAYPILQVVVFWFFVNINSILLSFRKLEYLEQSYHFVGLNNFKQVWFDFFNKAEFAIAFKNTFMIFGISLVAMLIPLIMSFYLFKKYPMSGLFKVVLFLPSIIPGMATVLCYQYFVNVAIPEIWKQLFNIEIKGLLSNTKTDLPIIIFFGIWMGFGGNFLLYAGAMAGINDSVIEAAQIDGCNTTQEFTKIVFPMIFPTFSTFVITSFATLFTNQMNVFSFYGGYADYSLYTIGYYLYSTVQNGVVGDYPYLSAMGIMLTILAIPLCLITKKLLEKLGPSEY